VLDNLEHVLEAAPIVPELLSRCPGLKLLATSREALRVEPEHRFAVAPLAVPADGRPAAVESSAAGALFFERARRHDGGFALTDGNAAAVAEICRRLDGLPLAIELAAARTPLLSPEELSRRLAHSLDVLGPGGRDAPPRQRTLRAAIDWSYRLLSPEEARAFARFAVFAGGATIEAAEYVTQADLGVLEGLVEKHLLERRQDAAGATRLVILETLRQFAAEHLDAEVRRRHCRYYVELAAQAEPALWTIVEAEWLARLDAEIGNLRAALDWSVGAGDPLGLRLAGLLAEYWDIRGFAGEGLQWLREAFETAGDAAPLQDRARARRAQAKLLEEQGSLEDPELREQGRAYASDALAMARETGDAAAIAAALLLLCHAEAEPGFPKRRRHALAEEALDHARRAGDRRLIAWALKDAALALAPAEAEAELQEAIAAMRQIGAARSLAMLYNSAAYSAIKAGDLQRARALLDQSEPLTLELDDPMLLAAVSGNAGLAALFAGRLDEARFAFEQQLDICLRLVIPWLASEGLAGLAAIAAREGDLERAARVLGAAGAHGPIGDAEVIARLERDFFAPAQESLGDELWRRSHAAGAGLGLADAVDLASAARRAAVHTHD
jgi:predicted ATPase